MLREASFRKWDVNFIVVTQYPILDPDGERLSIQDFELEAKQYVGERFKGVVVYSRGSGNWKEELREKIRK